MAQEREPSARTVVLDNVGSAIVTCRSFTAAGAARARACGTRDGGLGDLRLRHRYRRSHRRRQLVELRADAHARCAVFILDEPTATLLRIEIERIFDALRTLKAEGRAIIYITPPARRGFRLCGTVSVLRDGKIGRHRRTDEIDRAELMRMMLGRSMAEMYPGGDRKVGGPVLVVKSLSSSLRPRFRSRRATWRGDCPARQVGFGAIEVVRALAGLAFDATGEVSIAGKPLRPRSVAKAQARKLRFISEDRAAKACSSAQCSTQSGCHEGSPFTAGSAFRATRTAGRRGETGRCRGLDRARLLRQPMSSAAATSRSSPSAARSAMRPACCS